MEPDLDARNVRRGFLQRLFRRHGSPEAAPRREAVVVAFASGKGGTGKSFLATSLSVALHDMRRRVVVVDCDFGLANAHLLFGVTPRFTMRHLLDGSAAIQQAVTPTPYGPALVAGGSGISSLTELGVHHLQVVARSLRWLCGAFDVVLLDCAAGLSPQSLLMSLAATHVVVVTNPEIAALTDAYALIKCLGRQPACPALHLAVNRVADPALGQATFDRLAEVSRRFAGRSIHYAGAIPEDAAVTQRRLGQPPLIVSHPECRTSLAVLEMTRAMLSRTRGLLPQAVVDGGIDARMTAQLSRW
ncbi:MAG: P-loop NTPase [Planctomycetes bacterium]|nr:P-loop NTPase [Planctomycetota bacterium]